MKKYQRPWNLRRIFGLQTVVCVGSPEWPESGIAAQVIPDQPSSWTFHGRDVGNLPTCRLADLPTCRLADLPTWSWVTIGIAVRSISSRHSSGVSSIFRKISEDSGSNRASTTLQFLPSPNDCLKVYFGVIDPHHPPAVALFPTGNSE